MEKRRGVRRWAVSVILDGVDGCRNPSAAGRKKRGPSVGMTDQEKTNPRWRGKPAATREI
jgi:hypothetical protein